MLQQAVCRLQFSNAVCGVSQSFLYILAPADKKRNNRKLNSAEKSWHTEDRQVHMFLFSFSKLLTSFDVLSPNIIISLVKCLEKNVLQFVHFIYSVQWSPTITQGQRLALSTEPGAPPAEPNTPPRSSTTFRRGAEVPLTTAGTRNTNVALHKHPPPPPPVDNQGKYNPPRPPSPSSQANQQMPRASCCCFMCEKIKDFKNRLQQTFLSALDCALLHLGANLWVWVCLPGFGSPTRSKLSDQQHVERASLWGSASTWEKITNPCFYTK